MTAPRNEPERSPVELTDDQRTILNALREYWVGRGHCSVGELTGYLNQTRPRRWVWSYGGVAASLVRMEKRGLVAKYRVAEYRRTNVWRPDVFPVRDDCADTAGLEA